MVVLHCAGVVADRRVAVVVAHVQLQVILDASQLMRLARPWAKEAQQVVSPEPDEAQSSREGDAYEADSMAAKRRKRR